jgi:hypothetical protein
MNRPELPVGPATEQNGMRESTNNLELDSSRNAEDFPLFFRAFILSILLLTADLPPP